MKLESATPTPSALARRPARGAVFKSSSLSLHWQSRFLTICKQGGPLTMGIMLRHVGVNTIQS